MVKTFKYIFTRILIGVGIAIILMALKGGLIANVNAQSIYTIDINTTSMKDLDSSQEYTFNLPTDTFKNLGRGEILFSYYMTDYSDFAGTNGVNRSAVPRYMYISTHSGSKYICNIGSLGYQKLSEVFSYNASSSATNWGANEAMTSVFSATCPVELNDNDYVSSITAYQVGVGPNTYAQFSRYISFIGDSQAALKESQDKTNDLLESDEIDNNKASSDIDTMKGKVASNGTITQLLTLPIQLYQKILNSLNGSCSSINLGSLWGHDLSLTCINLENLLGSTLYNIIDILCCGLFILAFRKKMVDIFNHMTSLNDRGNELE